MAVDLNDLVESLRREVNPPGQDVFPDANDAAYLGYLTDGFWEIKLDQIDAFTDYTCDLAGEVTNTEGGDDLDRAYQQLIVLYSGIRMVRNELKNVLTLFRGKSGPVEFEQQQSAQLLKAVLDELKARRNLVLERMSDLGGTTTYYIDAIAARDDSIDSEFTYWYTG